MDHRLIPARFNFAPLAVATAVMTLLAVSNAHAASADLAVGDATAPAGRRAAVAFTVTRSGDTGFPVTVNYATADGTAKAGTDYTATSGTLTFATGETTKTVSVPVVAKSAVRPKTFTLGLSNAAAVPPPPIAFAGAGVIPAPGQHIASAVSADFNGDGKPDIAAIGFDANSVATLGIERNDTLPKATTDSFSTAYVLSGVTGGQTVAVADLNRDGKPDLVTGTTVLLNTTPAGSPTMTFTTAAIPGSSGSDVVVGDFDRDGLIDVAVLEGKLVHIYRNTTAKGAAQPTLQKVADVPNDDVPVGGVAHQIVTGDFDGDGKLDIATSNFSGFSVAVHLNATAAGGPITFGKEFQFGVAESPGPLAVGDLNGDGKADIVSANVGTSQLGTTYTVLMSKATAGSGTPDFTATSNYGFAPQGISLADMDGDGLADMVVAQGYNLQGTGGGAVTVYLNRTANGAQTPVFLAPVGVAQDFIPFYTLPADFNADGLLDIASSDFYFGNGIGLNFQKKVSTTPGTAVITDGSGTGTITRREPPAP